MTLLQEPSTPTRRSGAPVADRHDGRTRPLHAGDDRTIDLTADQGRVEPSDAPAPARRRETDLGPVHGPVEIDPSGRIPWRGMRIRRVRLTSVATISFIFWLLALAVLLGTTVVVWNVARAFGFIGEIETTVVTSLGLDAFEIDGGALFRIAAAATAFITTLGWVMTVLLAAVYNASGAVFGGLAVETGPLQRRRRVFSLRHRGFVTIRS